MPEETRETIPFPEVVEKKSELKVTSQLNRALEESLPKIESLIDDKHSESMRISERINTIANRIKKLMENEKRHLSRIEEIGNKAGIKESIIAEHSSQLSKIKKEIVGLKKSKNRLDSTVSKERSELKKLRDIQKRIKTEIIRKEKHLEKRRHQLEYKERKVGSAHRFVLEKKREIQEMRKQLRAKEKKLKAKETQIIDKETEILGMRKEYNNRIMSLRKKRGDGQRESQEIKQGGKSVK